MPCRPPRHRRPLQSHTGAMDKSPRLIARIACACVVAGTIGAASLRVQPAFAATGKAGASSAQTHAYGIDTAKNDRYRKQGSAAPIPQSAGVVGGVWTSMGPKPISSTDQ